ncbi:MAG: hypothetical protein HC802_16175 [Caldilineaceae bacterium]|nr:hypothetical protein [Caldilineaceae bacterium]
MSFGLIAYQSLWLKHYYPAPFYCALLNQQPMGFYSSEVIIGDAKRHGIDLLPPDVNRSAWEYTIEKVDMSAPKLRIGLRTVKGLGIQAWEIIEQARKGDPFRDLDDLCRRTRLHQDIVQNLIRSGALDEFGQRRELLWRMGDIDYKPGELNLERESINVMLPRLGELAQALWEYELLGLSPDMQIMVHYRDALRAAGILSTWQVKQEQAGRRVQVAGMVVIKQRPQTAGGILFISLEDEAGLLDLVVKPKVYQRLRTLLRDHPLLIFAGIVQRADQAVSVLVHQAQAL